jgi:hypothetical protein
MRPMIVLAVMFALAAPLAACAQSAEPMLGRGLDLPERLAGVSSAGARSAGVLRPSGVRLEYGGARGGGSGIRVSRVADNAFGPPGGDPVRSPGRTADAAAFGDR